MRVQFLSRQEAQVMLPEKAVMVSITNPGQCEVVLQKGWADVHRVSFYDIEKPYGGFELMTWRQAFDLILFLERAYDQPDVDLLVVHCEAGVSRSAAVAKFARYRLGMASATDRDASAYNRHVFRLLCVVLHNLPYYAVLAKLQDAKWKAVDWLSRTFRTA